MQHGGFHFHEAALFHEAAELAHDERTLAEYLARAGIHHQIDVALTIAGFHVGETAVLVGQRAERLAEQTHARAAQGEFAGLGAEEMTCHAHDVAHVELLEGRKRFVAEHALFGVALNAAAAIHDVEENHLAEGTRRHHASGNGKFLVQRLKLLAAHVGVGRAHVSGVLLSLEIVGIQRNARIQKIAGLAHAVLYNFVQFAVIGEILQHGHEIGRMFRLRGKLDGLAGFLLCFQKTLRYLAGALPSCMYSAALSLLKRPQRKTRFPAP